LRICGTSPPVLFELTEAPCASGNHDALRIPDSVNWADASRGIGAVLADVGRKHLQMQAILFPRQQARKQMGLFQRQAQFADMRKSPRYEVHYPAHVEIGGKATVLNCVICDISALGAKLTIRDAEHFPDEFTLLFRRRCRVVHRFDGQIGVRFV
jgi:hypothetical protein